MELGPPPLSDADLQSIKEVLAGHDYSFASINAVSKESAIKKKELEEVIAAYRRAVDRLTMAYIQVKAERDTTAKIWKMMQAASQCKDGTPEETRMMVEETIASMGDRIESNILRAVGSLPASQMASDGLATIGRSYAGVVRSAAAAMPQPSQGPGVGARRPLETIEVVPGGDIQSKLPNAQAVCDAVFTSIRPGEAGIKIDRVVKGRNKSVRIVADHNEISRLKPMLDGLGMEVKQIDKLNPRLLIKDIPESTDKARFVEDLVRQNLNGLGKEDVRLIYWSIKNQKNSMAVIEVSPSIRLSLLSQGRIYLGWSSCRVTDHVRVLQCFKCLAFGHIAKGCQVKEDICGHCGDKHESRACPKTGVRKCHNCEKAKMLATDHSALDSSACPILQRKLGDKAKMVRY